MVLRREAMGRDLKRLLAQVVTVIDQISLHSRSVAVAVESALPSSYKIYNLDKSQGLFYFSSPSVCAHFTELLFSSLKMYGLMKIAFVTFHPKDTAEVLHLYKVRFKTGKDPCVLAYQLYLALEAFAQLETELAYLDYCSGVVSLDAPLKTTSTSRLARFRSLPTHLSSREKVIRLLRSGS